MLSRTENFNKTFYSYCISEWNKLAGEIKTQRREIISDYEVYKCYKCYTFKIHEEPRKSVIKSSFYYIFSICLNPCIFIDYSNLHLI